MVVYAQAVNLHLGSREIHVRSCPGHIMETDAELSGRKKIPQAPPAK
jgi:hypothetical protein